MNRIQEFFWFTAPDRRFVHLSAAMRELKPQLLALNERRKQLQGAYCAIRNASNVSGKCEACQGRCCGGEYVPYYSGVDHLIRMFSDKPIDDYYNWWRPRSLPSAILEKVKSILTASKRPARPVPESMCPHHSPTGCVLAAEDRPIRCILWICDDLKRAIPPAQLREMGVITRELSSVSVEVLQCFKKIRG